MGTKKETGTRAIDIFRASYRSNRKEVVIPEVGITLYFPALTTASQQAVADRCGEKPEDVSHEAWKHQKNITLLIQQAENEDGSKAFAFGDMHHLMNEVPYLIMQQLVTEMYMAGMPVLATTVEEGKADSGTTKTA